MRETEARRGYPYGKSVDINERRVFGQDRRNSKHGAADTQRADTASIAGLHAPSELGEFYSN